MGLVLSYANLTFFPLKSLEFKSIFKKRPNMLDLELEKDPNVHKYINFQSKYHGTSPKLIHVMLIFG